MSRKYLILALIQAGFIFLLVDKGRAILAAVESAAESELFWAALLVVGLAAAVRYRSVLAQFWGTAASRPGQTLACLLPLLPIPLLVSTSAEYVHIPLYGLLALFLVQALAGPFHSRVLPALGLTNLISVLDEFFQWLHPERFFGLTDLGINLLSSVFGVMVLHLFSAPKERLWPEKLPFFGSLGSNKQPNASEFS